MYGTATSTTVARLARNDPSPKEPLIPACDEKCWYAKYVATTAHATILPVVPLQDHIIFS